MEGDWKFGLGAGGGLCIVKCSSEEATAAEGEGEGEDGMWSGEWMALLGGETLLAITLLENYDPEPSAAGPAAAAEEKAAPGEEKAKVGSCDAELFVLLLQLYTVDDDSHATTEQEQERRVGKLKAGLVSTKLSPSTQSIIFGLFWAESGSMLAQVLEALATSRSAALCGKASLPTLLPMLEALLRKPTDSLTGANASLHSTVCRHGAHEAGGATGGFLSGESAEEERSSRNAAADAATDAIDTLQLVLGVLLAIFDPEVEQMAGASDWGSSAVGGGASAITAAAAILRQLEHLTSAAAAARQASAGEAAAAAEQPPVPSGKRKHPSKQGLQRVFASSSEGLLVAAVEREAAGAAELQAAAQLATIVRMRILAALSGTTDACPGTSSAGSDDGQPVPGAAGSIEYLSVEARVTTQALYPTPPQLNLSGQRVGDL